MTSTNEPLMYVKNGPEPMVGANDDPYPYREFDLFFRDRPGWLPIEPVSDGPEREFFYDRSFTERDSIVDTMETGLLPMSVEISGDIDTRESNTLVHIQMPALELASRPDPPTFEVDIAALDADEQIAEVERQARATSAVWLFEDALYGRH